MGSKTIVMTDIHGCIREFEKLLKLVRPNPDEDTFVFLGDAVDRGPDEWAVVEKLIALRWEFGDERFIWLMGNHEMKLVEKHRKKKRMPFYVQHDILYYLPVFRNLPFKGESDECIFVHAGYSDNPKKNTKKLLLEDRSVLRRKRLYSGKLYIAGHSPIVHPLYVDPYGNITKAESGMDLPEHGAIFMDTGCINGGRLTAMVIKDHKIQFYSVPSEQKPALPVLEAGESNRNPDEKVERS